MYVMKKAPKLSNDERSEIQILNSKGYSARAIATALGRSPNTIASELKRNSYKDGRYVATSAKHKAYVRHKYARYQGKKIQEDDELRSFIIQKLSEHYNPDEISGMMKTDLSLGFYASKTAIYDWLYSSRGQRYCQYLYSARYRPRSQKKNKTKRLMIPDRTSVHERSLSALDRAEAGHLEFDSVVSSKRSHSKYALAVVQERASRLVRAKLVTNLKPSPYAETITELVDGLKVQSLTTDNGIENKHHKAITNKTGAPVFFTDPYSSWQKGGVENANKMLRRYFPKGTDFSKVTQTEVDEALTRINNKPRKILGYKSSLQVAKEKGLILDRVS
jgi:IS30 family transposase